MIIGGVAIVLVADKLWNGKMMEMTITERNIKLKQLVTCLKCKLTVGRVCDDCPTQYQVGTMNEIVENLEEISKILEQQQIEKCKWIRYDYRTICPKNHDIDNPYWRIPENTECLKYCPYCGKEIEVTK